MRYLFAGIRILSIVISFQCVQVDINRLAIWLAEQLSRVDFCAISGEIGYVEDKPKKRHEVNDIIGKYFSQAQKLREVGKK